jgi:anaerobic ribonucleoside-triphosphate reductase
MSLTEEEKEKIGWYKGSSPNHLKKCTYWKVFSRCGFMNTDKTCSYIHRCKYQYDVKVIS